MPWGSTYEQQGIRKKRKCLVNRQRTCLLVVLASWLLFQFCFILILQEGNGTLPRNNMDIMISQYHDHNQKEENQEKTFHLQKDPSSSLGNNLTSLANDGKWTATSTNTDTAISDNNSNFHIVFSTDCSGYQHWQGILLYYSALRVNQPGTITRIASGCTTPAQETTIANEWRRIDPTGQKFRVHFAPSTTLQGEKYKYSNKPGGLLHWIQQNEQEFFHHHDQDDTVICLLDPDMILLKPITADLIDKEWTVRNHGSNQVEYIARSKGGHVHDNNNNATTVAQFLRVKSLPFHDNLPSRVTTGHPAGQHFGIGGSWVQGMEKDAKPVWKNFSKAVVCGDQGPCTTTTSNEAWQKYAVGPVYLAKFTDWKRIATTWWDFVPKVYPQYPYLLAEMYSFTMAVANLKLPFTLFSSYMVTGAEVGSPTEAWSWIDDFTKEMGVNNHVHDDPSPMIDTLCKGAGTFQTPTWTEHPLSLALPNTLHYCQRYKLDINSRDAQDELSFLFAKRKIPHDAFSCPEEGSSTASQQLDPIPFDIQDLIDQARSTKKDWTTKDRRTLFALCHVVPIFNWARKMYREDVCSNSPVVSQHDDAAEAII